MYGKHLEIIVLLLFEIEVLQRKYGEHDEGKILYLTIEQLGDMYIELLTLQHELIYLLYDDDDDDEVHHVHDVLINDDLIEVENDVVVVTHIEGVGGDDIVEFLKIILKLLVMLC